MVSRRNIGGQLPFVNRRCPFCNRFFPGIFTLFLHCIRVHLEMQCRVCGVVRVGYILLVHHFVQVHMQMNISIDMGLHRIGVILRDIPLCHASLDDMQSAADSIGQSLLQRGYMASDVPASLVRLIISQSATQGGTNSAQLQIDQNIVDMRENQSPVTSESSQEHTESAENGSPPVNQLYDSTDEDEEDSDSDDEESD